MKDDSLYMCPECGGRKFAVTAHVTQDWRVNEYGVFDICLMSCVEVTHYPDDDDIWSCLACGFSDSGRAFKSNCVHQCDEHRDKGICHM